MGRPVSISPLRYPGGKSRLAPFVKSIIRENNLAGIEYVEPYAGGASVGLSLLFENYVSRITINDIDRSIYAFWCSIIEDTERFCRKISKIKVSPHNWKIQKNMQKNKETADIFDLGFSTFFLNRTNISGVLAAGIIGGYKQAGNYKIDARFNKAKLIDSIERIARHADKIKVRQHDACNLIAESNEDVFFYFDPPYVKKAKELYRNSYEESDHRQVAEVILSKKNSPWILSYDKCALIDELYGDCRSRLEWQLLYGTSNRIGQESIFMHPSLKFEESAKYLVARGGKVK